MGRLPAWPAVAGAGDAFDAAVGSPGCRTAKGKGLSPGRRREPVLGAGHSRRRYFVTAVTVNRPMAPLPRNSGAYMASAWAGGRVKTPGVTARSRA